MTCKHTARYVIVETTYDAPEDDHTGAMLEICEIEVYGMHSLYNEIVYIIFLHNFSRSVTNEIILFLCSENWWIIPEIVILPFRKQLHFTENSYTALPKLLYHPCVQNFFKIITSGSKLSEANLNSSSNIKMSGNRLFSRKNPQTFIVYFEKKIYISTIYLSIKCAYKHFTKRRFVRYEDAFIIKKNVLMRLIYS